MDEFEFDTGDKEFVDGFSTSNNEVLLLNELQGLVTSIKWSPTDVTDLFNALLKRFESTTNDRSHLHSWILKTLDCIKMNYITPSWRCKTGKTLIELVQDKSVTDENLKKCLADDTEKQLDEILEEIRQLKSNQTDENLLDKVKDIVSSVDEDLTSGNDESLRNGLKKDLLKLCRAVEKEIHFRPRLTQMVSWCIMALSETGQLIQVGTGEGKSCIVAMFAAFQALKGKYVDILTSSSVLAERDLKDWRKFYGALKISVDCNTNKQAKDLRKCYKSQVVYGTVEEFAGHWLRHHFHRMDIFGQRTFQCAIVDEVDSMMLDKGLHMVYLSSDMPALQHLNPLLAFIWDTANRYSTEAMVGQKYPFHQILLENIIKGDDIDEFTILELAEDTGLLAKGSVKDLRKNPSLLTEKTANIMANQLAEFFKTVERRFPGCQFALHCGNINGAIEEMNKGSQPNKDERQRVPLLLLDGGFCQYMYSDGESILRAEAEIKRAVHFTPCELSQNKYGCYVPGFLSDLVKSKLKVWIKNAFQAQRMTVDHEYIIERHGIVPVDYSCTGVVENCMKWTDGLQQFLEMKHECKLSDMTVISNYMSNVGLFGKYGNQIFGISGTLGQQVERETLQKIYPGIKTCQIPSFKRRKLFEVEGVIVDNEKEWIEKICNVVRAQIMAQRPALVICETINRAKIVHNALGDEVSEKRLYISNNMDNTTIFAKKLEAGNVIIATNLAGRGTDLQVSEQVKRAGGLFVVQTFLPKNARVEEQAFGRTARQGSPGSAQLIICSCHLSDLLKLLASVGKLQSFLKNNASFIPLYQSLFQQLFRLYHKNSRNEVAKSLALTALYILTKISDSEIKTLKAARNDIVERTLSRYLESDIPRIKKKEELFSQYLEVLNEDYERGNKPADSYLAALNEFWGLWLLMNFSEEDSIAILKKKLNEDLIIARQKLNQRESPSTNLHHFTVFGNDLNKKGNLAESIEMYTKAIEQDHCWAAVAYYNRAFTSLAQQDRRQDRNCISQALEDLQNSLKSVELYCEQTELIHRYSTQQSQVHQSDSITRFDSHIMARCEVLQCFKGNIIEATKKLKKTRDTGGVVKLQKKLVNFLVSSRHLISMAVHSLQSLSDILSRDPLKIRQVFSDPAFDISNEILFLKSLGLTHVYTLEPLSIPYRPFWKIRSALHKVLDRVMGRLTWFFK